MPARLLDLAEVDLALCVGYDNWEQDDQYPESRCDGVSVAHASFDKHCTGLIDCIGLARSQSLSI